MLDGCAASATGQRDLLLLYRARLTVTVPFFAKVEARRRPCMADSEAAFVPRACVTFRAKAFASCPVIVTAPRKVLFTATCIPCMYRKEGPFRARLSQGY